VLKVFKKQYDMVTLVIQKQEHDDNLSGHVYQIKEYEDFKNRPLKSYGNTLYLPQSSFYKIENDLWLHFGTFHCPS
jgi:hypothetical protein